MFRVKFDNSEREMLAKQNREQNYKFALSWMQRHNQDFFQVQDGENVHELKAFFNAEKSIVWLAFRSRKFPSFMCPVGLSQKPEEFRLQLDQEWQNMISNIKSFNLFHEVNNGTT